MIIPSFDLTHLTNEDGSVHPDAKIFFDQLINALQKNLNQEGYKLPQQPTTNITQLNTPESKGSVIYDQTTNQAKININGTYKVVPTVA